MSANNNNIRECDLTAAAAACRTHGDALCEDWTHTRARDTPRRNYDGRPSTTAPGTITRRRKLRVAEWRPAVADPDELGRVVRGDRVRRTDPGETTRHWPESSSPSPPPPPRASGSEGLRAAVLPLPGGPPTDAAVAAYTASERGIRRRRNNNNIIIILRRRAMCNRYKGRGLTDLNSSLARGVIHTVRTRDREGETRGTARDQARRHDDGCCWLASAVLLYFFFATRFTRERDFSEHLAVVFARWYRFSSTSASLSSIDCEKIKSRKVIEGNYDFGVSVRDDKSPLTQKKTPPIRSKD